MAIRVLHLGSPNGLYGAERWILALVKHLDRVEVQSHVGVILDEPGLDPPLLHEAASLGLETVGIDAPGRFNWSAVGKLREYIQTHGIDILHTHFYKTDLIGLLAVRGTTCKLVTTPHGWSTQAGWALRCYEALDRLLFRYFDAVVPLSPELARELESKAGSKLRYIQNGVDVGEIDAVKVLAPEAQEWRERGEFVVGYIGQLIARKGLSTLLQAFRRLGAPDARLVLVGEGPQRAELEALSQTLGIASKVDFLGYRKDRVELLRGFDVFVLPSQLEGIPRCLMESMAAGVPVVATDIPGCRELIQHEANGLLYKPGDVDGLVRALRAIGTKGLRRELALAGRAEVEQNFSATGMAISYQDLYGKLLR